MSICWKERRRWPTYSQRSCERLVILATSREGLGIEGERLVPVPPLAVPDTDADLTAITQAEAVRLFAERAAAVKPEFAVTAENAAPVAAVVRRLDGIALAIELAAARIAAMTPAELARRLQRSFAVLGAGRRGTLPHHQTLRATIDWSYQLLAEPEQRLLARLSVFAGGCTLEAAETVCGGDGIDPDTVFELLASLVARSLVVTEEHGPETRYRLLETIREYGEERLGEAGELERWRARHGDYYVGVLSRIRELAHDPRAEVFWGVRLSAEQDNLLAAWSWAIDTRNVDTAFSILAGFAPLEVSFRYPLLLDGEAALELPGAAAHPGYPLALAVSAMFASNRADVTVTEELCRARRRGQRTPRSPRLAGRGSHLLRPLKHRRVYCRRVRRLRPPQRAGRWSGADRRRPRRHLPLARHRRGRLRTRRRRAQGGPAGPRGAYAGPADRSPGPHRHRPARRRHDRRRDRPRTGPRRPAREPRAQHGARLSKLARPRLGRRDRIPPKRPDRHT